MSKSADETLHAANLHFYINPNLLSDGDEHFQLSKVNPDESRVVISTLTLTEQEVEHHRNSPRWHTFRIRNLEHLYVPNEELRHRELMNTSHENNSSLEFTLLKFEIKCIKCTSLESVLMEGNPPRPYMEAKYEKVNHRSRRHALTCRPGPSSCCKVNKTVTIEELGWQDWIVSPAEIQANYCAGRCMGQYSNDVIILYLNSMLIPTHTLTLAEPIILKCFHSVLCDFSAQHFHLAGSSNAHLMAMANEQDYQPCCSPGRFRSINILFLDSEGKVILKNIPDLVVERCSCL